MTYTKDQSIVAQVAAKIGSDLAVANNGDFSTFMDNYEAVRDLLFKDHGWGVGAQTIAPAERYVQTAPQQQSYTPSQAEQALTETFGAQDVGGSNWSVSVKGDQHGPLPDWLFRACADAGVSEVWDNRDGLRENAKRPWFKEVGGNEMPFWPPRAGGARR